MSPLTPTLSPVPRARGKKAHAHMCKWREKKRGRWQGPCYEVELDSGSGDRPMARSARLEDAFDFDGHVIGQGGDADRQARMPTGFAEDADEEIRGAVDHLRLVGE